MSGSRDQDGARAGERDLNGREDVGTIWEGNEPIGKVRIYVLPNGARAVDAQDIEAAFSRAMAFAVAELPRGEGDVEAQRKSVLRARMADHARVILRDVLFALVAYGITVDRDDVPLWARLALTVSIVLALRWAAGPRRGAS